jgi:hypothetical protein
MVIRKIKYNVNDMGGIIYIETQHRPDGLAELASYI